MAISTGKVDYVKFGDDYGFVMITDPSDGLTETFILWFGDNVVSPGPVALYSMLLTTAAVRKLTVEISHDDDSALIRQVKMNRPP